MKFFEALANIFRIPDLRKRVLFTLGLLAVYRMARSSPLPVSTLSGCSNSSIRIRVRCSDSSICSAAACSAG